MSIEERAAGLKLLRELLPEVTNAHPDMHGDGFASELGDLALEWVYGRLWTRPGLDHRSRSLVTLGVVIGQRNWDQVRTHLLIAGRVGLSTSEIEEIIYQISAYAGFPTAVTAAAVAADVCKPDVAP